MEGPIVVQINKLLKYLPLTPDGRFFSIELYKACKFSINWFSAKSDFPKLTCTIPVLSALYSNFPFLNSDNVLVKVVLTVPDFGDGIKPFGPETRPSFDNLGIISGVATNKSKLMIP